MTILTRTWLSPGRSDCNVAVTNPTDRELVDACLDGQGEAFETIVARHRQHVYQLCFRFVGNHEDASDLAQDVFVRAFRGLHRFRGHAPLKTWLYRIAVNVCLNNVTARTPSADPIIEQCFVSPAESPADHVLREERAEHVRAAIARLPKKQRATLILRIYHELPHEQIASVLGSSVGAVRANFFHALNNLKRRLGTI